MARLRGHDGVTSTGSVSGADLPQNPPPEGDIRCLGGGKCWIPACAGIMEALRQAQGAVRANAVRPYEKLKVWIPALRYAHFDFRSATLR